MTENRLLLTMALSMFIAGPVRGQTAGGAAPGAAATSPAAAQASDRAQKEADRPLYWIRVLADKPVAKPAAAAPAQRPPVPATTAAAGARAQPAEVARVAPTSAEVARGAPAPAAAPATPHLTDAAAASAAPVPTSRNVAAPAPSGTATAVANAAPVATAGVDPTAASPAEAAAIAAPSLASPLPDLPAAQPPEEPDAGLVLTESVDPRFPITLMNRLRKGQVEVRFVVAADGHVESVSVEHSTNHGLEPAALDAVKQWRFKPGPRGHTAVVDLAFNMDS
jgi:TonB family protein